MTENIRKFFNSIVGKKIAFCGLGKSNLPLIKMFSQKGAIVTACDSKNEDQLSETIKELRPYNVRFHLGKNYLENLDFDIIFRSPGLKFFSPELIQARSKGYIVTSEMELFFDLCPCKIVGVTGSDGKTTTTTIISEILKQDGKTVHLGGNIGTPLLPQIENIGENDIAVVELSSFQLISMRRSPDVAVVTNVSPNHLDVHNDMTEYIEAKKNIILHQNAFSRAVLNMDNEITKQFGDSVRGQTFFFSSKSKCDSGAYLCDNTIYFSKNGVSEPILNVDGIRILGKHNVENYMAAICAVFEDVSVDSIKKVAKNFSGVEHRTEFVREVDHVKYYNDSIASSPTRTICGTLSLFPQKIILISGGYDKKIPFDTLGSVIAEKVKILILLGQTANKIRDAVINSSKFSPESIKIVFAKDMQEAVNIARENAVLGDIVSLSPACASFDLYENFMERGWHFKDLINKL